jgi:hypothetical protein
VAQHQDLGVLGTIAAAAQHQQVDDQADKSLETPHPLILAASAEEFRCRREVPNHGPGRVIGTHTVCTSLGIASNPTGVWTTQAARNFMIGYDRTIRFLIRDGAGEFVAAFGDDSEPRERRSSSPRLTRRSPMRTRNAGSAPRAASSSTAR